MNLMNIVVACALHQIVFYSNVRYFMPQTVYLLLKSLLAVTAEIISSTIWQHSPTLPDL